MNVEAKIRRFFKQKRSSTPSAIVGQDSRRNRIKKYLASSCECQVSDLKENMPLNKLTTPYDKSATAYYTIVYWLETRFNQSKAPVSSEFIEKKTVGDLLDYLTT